MCIHELKFNHSLLKKIKNKKYNTISKEKKKYRQGDRQYFKDQDNLDFRLQTEKTQNLISKY